MKRIVGALAGATLLAMLIGSPALATKPSPDHKATICHRTASDTNPYVFIDVDVASLDAHLNNLPGHPAKHWKSDGTWRGVPHVKGDPKNDYLAKTKADCEQTPEVTPSPTPSETPSPTPSATPSATPTATPTPTSSPSSTASPTPSATPTVAPTPPATHRPPTRPTSPPTDTVSPTSSSGSSMPAVIFILAAISGAAWWTRRIAVR